MDDFLSFIKSITKDDVTFILALIGSIGTTTGWIYHWIHTRKNITFTIVGNQFSANGLLLYFQITNNALQTITINDISVLINDSEFHCSAMPVRVLEEIRRIGKETIDRKEYYSIKLPLTLSPLCGDSGYLNFSFHSEIQQPFPSKLTFVIRTNRGRALKKKLSLGNLLD